MDCPYHLCCKRRQWLTQACHLQIGTRQKQQPQVSSAQPAQAAAPAQPTAAPSRQEQQRGGQQGKGGLFGFLGGSAGGYPDSATADMFSLLSSLKVDQSQVTHGQWCLNKTIHVMAQFSQHLTVTNFSDLALSAWQ